MDNNLESLVKFKGMDDIVYYHDKSISCPKAWTNRYWKPVKVKETDHFIFYKIVPNNKQFYILKNLRLWKTILLMHILV